MTPLAFAIFLIFLALGFIIGANEDRKRLERKYESKYKVKRPPKKIDLSLDEWENKLGGQQN